MTSRSEHADPVKRAVAAVVRALRAERKLSQSKLAASAGMHRNFISGLERGKYDPGLATVRRLAAALGVDAVDFVARVESELAHEG